MKNIIAISGKSGCGNTSVSKLLAEKLAFTHINYTFRQMAAELEVPLMELVQKAAADSRFDLELDRHQVELAQIGNSVLASRLAVWLLREQAFTIYLNASPIVRAKRLAGREGKDFDLAYKETASRDAQDHDRFLALYKHDVDDYSFVDLVVDVSVMNVEEIVSHILEKLEVLKA